MSEVHDKFRALSDTAFRKADEFVEQSEALAYQRLGAVVAPQMVTLAFDYVRGALAGLEEGVQQGIDEHEADSVESDMEAERTRNKPTTKTETTESLRNDLVELLTEMGAHDYASVWRNLTTEQLSTVSPADLKGLLAALADSK